MEQQIGVSLSLCHSRSLSFSLSPTSSISLKSIFFKFKKKKEKENVWKSLYDSFQDQQKRALIKIWCQHFIQLKLENMSITLLISIYQPLFPGNFLGPPYSTFSVQCLKNYFAGDTSLQMSFSACVWFCIHWAILFRFHGSEILTPTSQILPIDLPPDSGLLESAMVTWEGKDW